MHINKKIVVSGMVIMAAGIWKAWTSKPPKPISRIILGGYVLMILLAIVDTFGGQAANITGNIALVAMATMLLGIVGQFAIQSQTAVKNTQANVAGSHNATVR